MILKAKEWKTKKDELIRVRKEERYHKQFNKIFDAVNKHLPEKFRIIPS